jgi:dihydropteroate synthase
MRHNVLVLLTARLPDRGDEIRDLGLPAVPRRTRRDRISPDATWCRVEGMTARQAGGLVSAMRRSGGSAAPAPARRAAPGLSPLGAHDPGRAVILQGDGAAFQELIARAPRIAPDLASEIRAALDAAASFPAPLRLRDGGLLPSGRTLVMGILNVTPDSFSDGGRFLETSCAVVHGSELAHQGADILDIGGESTRPGAQPVPVAQELDRILPVLEGLRALDRPLSVDTYKPVVMLAALAAGASMINDINALQSEGALEVVQASDCGVCLMHKQGDPQTMQQDPHYDDVVGEVREFLAQRVAACQAAGVSRDRVVIDPGFGFGKRSVHNLELLRNLRSLASLEVPVLAGLSRKSTLGKITNQPVERRAIASVTAALLAVQLGAAIVRVHDVAQTRDALRILGAVEELGFSFDD